MTGLFLVIITGTVTLDSKIVSQMSRFKWNSCVVSETKCRRNYSSFESVVPGRVESVTYNVGDTVLISSNSKKQPYIGEIMSLYEKRASKDKCLSIKWFYRQEDILPNTFESIAYPLASNEVFYSSYCDDDNELSVIIAHVQVVFANAETCFPGNVNFEENRIFFCKYEFNTSENGTRGVVKPINEKRLLRANHEFGSLPCRDDITKYCPELVPVQWRTEESKHALLIINAVIAANPTYRATERLEMKRNRVSTGVESPKHTGKGGKVVKSGQKIVNKHRQSLTPVKVKSEPYCSRVTGDQDYDRVNDSVVEVKCEVIDADDVHGTYSHNRSDNGTSAVLHVEGFPEVINNSCLVSVSRGDNIGTNKWYEGCNVM